MTIRLSSRSMTRPPCADHAHQLTEKAAHGELAGKAELLGLLASVSQEFVASPVMGETLANATQRFSTTWTPKPCPFFCSTPAST
ncbi:MAG: hypothetical protein IPO00_00575 [Betaproteobacteria bacterium]|nr:hypothetical protein [Betaproteobacteria bacterium]